MKLHPQRVPPLPTRALAAAMLLASLGAALPCAAQSVWMSWGSCAVPPVLDATIARGADATLYVYASGLSKPAYAYQTDIVYGSTNGAVPDAWRFDDGGCQGSTFLTLSGTAPPAVAQSCPALQDAAGPHEMVPILLVTYPAGFTSPLPGGLTRLTVFVWSSVAFTPVAGTTYFLMSAEFNQLYGVNGAGSPANSTCGGLEQPMCFALFEAKYYDPVDALPYDFAYVGWQVVMPHFGYDPPRVMVSANMGGPGGGGSCWETPARPATWGQIKAQYRN